MLRFETDGEYYRARTELGVPNADIECRSGSDRDVPYQYGKRLRLGRQGPFSDYQYYRLMVVRGKVQDTQARGYGLYADDLHPSHGPTVPYLLQFGWPSEEDD